jgi:NADH-quinone oxidoreductase subunit E
MSVRRLADQQPESFAFSEANLAWANTQLSKYPEGRQASAVISLLWRVQEQEGWVSEPAIRFIAEFLDMPTIRVLEVATFYTMFNLAPVGRIAHVTVCGTTPCWLRGAEDLKNVCRKRIHPEQFHLSDDGTLSWEEVECLGACVNAPMVQIGADTYEDLTPEILERLIDDLVEGRPVKPGTQIDRQFAAPVGGPTTLKDVQDIDAVTEDAVEDRPAQTETAAATGEANRPKGLSEARGGTPDDLKKISGIGPKIEGILHDLGIYHFDQIASWRREEVDWVDDYLKFKGRIGRDDWIGQAKTLGAGEPLDSEAKMPTKAASDREAPEPKKPLADSSDGEGP